MWPKHVAWYNYQTNKGVLNEWFYTKFSDIIIIIIIIPGISFMQGINTSIPETKHIPREHCVAAILM